MKGYTSIFALDANHQKAKRALIEAEWVVDVNVASEGDDLTGRSD